MNDRLVRDNVPDMIRSTGARPIIRKAEHEEYLRLLRGKLMEVTSEFLAHREFRLTELIDILEAVRALAYAYGVPLKVLERERAHKVATHGAFKEYFVWSGNE